MPVVLKFRSLNLLEPSGPLQACNGIALALPFTVLCNKYVTTLNNGICMHSNRSGSNVTRDVPYTRLMDHSPTNILPPKLDSDSMLNAERSKSILNVPETDGAPKSSASDSKLAVDYFNTAVTKESCQQGTTNVVLVCGAEVKKLSAFGCMNTFVKKAFVISHYHSLTHSLWLLKP